MPDPLYPPAPTPDDPLPPAITAPVREQAVQRLCTHFAQDHLEVAEFERRLDVAYTTGSLIELERLTADLPAIPAGQEATEPLSQLVTLDPSTTPDERDFLVAVMGGTERKGLWTPPKRLTVLAVMGGADLDFRECQFGSPVTEVVIVALMGGVDIVVPPGVRVESKGIAIMGAFEGASGGTPTPGAPVIKLSGLVCMGAVEIKVRLPGETNREARKRLKAERKARLRASGSGD